MNLDNSSDELYGLAVDGYLCESDSHLFDQAATGDPTALQRLCERFQHLALAYALHRNEDWEGAHAAVEPVLRNLCRQVVTHRCCKDVWIERIFFGIQEYIAVQAGPALTSEEPAVGSIANVPRIARRRAIKSAMSQLTVAQRLAVLMSSVARLPPTELAGMVAHAEEEALIVLAEAWELLAAAIQRAGMLPTSVNQSPQ